MIEKRKKKDKIADNKLKSVLDLLLENKVEAAEKEVREAIRLNPKNPKVHKIFSLILFHQDKMEEAEKEVREAIRLNPRDAEAHDNLSGILASQSKMEEAEKEVRKAIKLNPKNPKVHKTLSWILFRQDKMEEAEKEVREAIRLNPEDAEAYCNLSDILFDQDKTEDAEKEVREAIRLNPEDAEAYGILSRILASQGKMEESEKEVREAIRLNPEGAEAHETLSKILTSQKKMEEAEKEAREAINYCTDASHHINLSRVLFLKGKSEEAEREIKDVIKIHPENAKARADLSRILWASQYKMEEAEKEAREAIKLDPENANAHEVLARIFLSQEKLDDAEKEAKNAVKLELKEAVYRSILSKILFYQDKTEEAEKEAREALNLNPNNAEAHDILARLLQIQRKFTEAEIEAKEAVKNCPGLNHRQVLISILLDLNNYEEAETKAKDYVKTYTDTPISHLILSEVLFTTGKIEDAEKELLEAINKSDEKEKCEILLYIGTLLLSQGKFEAANVKIDDAINCYKSQADKQNEIKAIGFKKWAIASEKWKEGDIRQSIVLYSEANKLFDSINNKLAEYMETMAQFCSIDSEIQGIINSTDHLIIKDRTPHFLKKAEKIVIKIKKEPERSLVEARITYYRVILQFLQEISNIDETSNILEKESNLKRFEKSLEEAYLIFKKYNSTIGISGYHSFMLQIISAKELFKSLKNEDASKYYEEIQNWLDLHFPRIKETLTFYDGTLSNEISQYFMGKSRKPKIFNDDEMKHGLAIGHPYPKIQKRVLIFGPGEESEDYSLRIDIRKILGDLKFETLFPEDFRREIDLKNWLDKNKINLTYKQESALSNVTGRELILAENCDLLIILLMHPGAISEFSQFYTDSRVASKIRVLIPMELYKSESYIRAGPLQMFEEIFRHVYPFEGANQAKNFILQISKSDVAYDYLIDR